ncbi:MAG: hypothetical protein ACJ75H_09905 [Thermoanaerobaculia bacterium]
MKNKDVVVWGLTPIIDELERIKARLAGLVESLPPAEVAPAEAEDVGLRDLLGCTLTDRLEPALRDLRALIGKAEAGGAE